MAGLSKFINHERKKPEYEPTVTLVVTARNEERVIREKIQNSFELDYPDHLLNILIVSDDSTDCTNAYVRDYADPRIALLELVKRHGKTAAQNVAVQNAQSEILVFSDANAMYDSKAIKHLVKHFEDPQIGCVSGELFYLNSKGSSVGEEINFCYIPCIFLILKYTEE